MKTIRTVLALVVLGTSALSLARAPQDPTNDPGACTRGSKVCAGS